MANYFITHSSAGEPYGASPEKENTMAKKDFKEYPKMVYPKGKISMTGGVIVQNKEEEEALIGKKEEKYSKKDK